MSSELGRNWIENSKDSLISGFFKNHRDGYALEAGAFDGVTASPTLVLEKTFDWTVLCVEANPYYEDTLRLNRELVLIKTVGESDKDDVDFFIDPEPSISSLVDSENRLQIKTQMWSIDHCLSWAQFPHLDLLCLDLEGYELQALHGIDFNKWKVPMVVLENLNVNDHFLRDYMQSFGYYMAARVWYDEFYIIKRWD